MNQLELIPSPPRCTGSGTGSAARLSCGLSSPSYRSAAQCGAGLKDTYLPTQCQDGHWHAVRRATVTPTDGDGDARRDGGADTA